MDAAFDRMFDLLNDAQYDDKLIALEHEIENLQAPREDNIKAPIPTVEVDEFDPENNLLDRTVLEKFVADDFKEQAMFTKPTTTTNTMEGCLSNVEFHEAELIQMIICDEDIVAVRCNFGKVIYEGYEEPLKLRTSKKGRKRKKKQKKQRKIQGTGEEFNSQATFVVRSNNSPIIRRDDGNYIVPASSRVYKFKIFRTGKIQLPGVRPDLINDVIECAQKIVKALNFYLHPGVEDPAKLVRIINLNPVMKNYKFMVKLVPNQMLDLANLKRILLGAKLIGPADDRPKIFDVKYTREDTKLSIKFHTPIYKKPRKNTRVNIFMRGKINILGAFETAKTIEICDYLHELFMLHCKTLIVTEHTSDVEKYEIIENIEHKESLDDIKLLIARMINILPELPYVSESDVDEIFKHIN